MFDKFFGAVNGLVQKFQESFSSQPPYINPRLGSYIDFQLSNSVMNYITINDKRLYYESYNPQATVQGLQDQFRQFTGRDLVLESEVISISPDMPLTNIIKSNQARNVFEEIINKIDKKQKISPQQISPQKKQTLKQIIKACNSFKNYNAKIIMYNGLLKPIQLGMKVQATTTFKQIINEMNKHPLIAGDDIIFESEHRVFQQSQYSRTFEELNIKQRDFIARYTNRYSYLRGNTLITVPTQEQIVEIRELDGLYDNKIVSYDFIKGKAIINRMISSQTQKIKQFYRLILAEIQVSQQRNEVILECTEEVKVSVLTQDFDEIWVPVKKLRLKDRVNGISHKLNKINIYQVKTVEKIALDPPELFYGLQISPSHQYIANNIIVHNNNNKFTITAIFSDGTTKQKKQITFLRHQKISKHFKDSICYLGGLQLKNSQTFGDYQIQQFDIIYVYKALSSRSSVKKDREIKVTQYKNKTFDKDEFIQTEKSRMTDSCLAIYNERIISVAEIGKIIEDEVDSDANILVSKRAPFERLNYLLNKQPVYANKEEQIAKEIWQLKKNDPSFMKIRKAMEAEKSKISQITALGIYMYTLEDKQAEIPLSPFYSTVNRFLRDEYRFERENQQSKFLPIAGWILKSLMKMPCSAKDKIVYRGVGSIKLQKAFNLSNSEIKQNQIVVFTSFTSTTQSKKIAQQFAKQHGSILTLKVRRGRQIQKYSRYSNQKQILILPFTYFAINSFNLEQNNQTAELQQIPLPWTNSDKIVFWVDDKPQNNYQIIKFCFQPSGIEVVQVLSTRIMKIILKNFFWIYKMLNKKVVILSDMHRFQDGIQNKFAGIDLFKSIFHEYGLSNKAIIYTSEIQQATKNLKESNLQGANWLVTSDYQQLIKQVMLQFQKF